MEIKNLQEISNISNSMEFYSVFDLLLLKIYNYKEEREKKSIGKKIEDVEYAKLDKMELQIIHILIEALNKLNF